MNERRAGEILDELSRAVPDGLLLWRGEGLGGSDVDAVALPGHEHGVTRALRACGLAPAPQDPGQVLWRLLPGPTVVVDVLAPYAWPPMYPPLERVVGRAARGSRGLLVASAGDRLLFHAAEALAGWPAEKTRRRLDAALAEPGARASLDAALREEPRLRGLASLAVRRHPPSARLLPRAATRSPEERAAVRARLAARVGVAQRHPLPPPVDGRPGLLIALSGMDGAGKSTAALGLVEALEASGRPAIVQWTRVAGELRVLNLVARGVRRLLGRSESLAGEAPQTAPSPEAAPARPPAGSASARVIDGGWVASVAFANVLTARRAERIRRRGLSVVCDRWLADALVDVRLRYGRRPAAEWVLRRGYPRADHAVLLDVDRETAAHRKPGDQPLEVLGAMAERYAELAAALGLARVDAGRPSDAVLEELRALALKAGSRSPDHPGDVRDRPAA